MDLLKVSCVQAGSSSCLLVFETVSRADSHFPSSFTRCQESSPLLRKGPSQLLASPWATPPSGWPFDCGLGRSRGSPDGTGHSSSAVSVSQRGSEAEVLMSSGHTWSHTKWTVRNSGWGRGSPGESFVPPGWRAKPSAVPARDPGFQFYRLKEVREDGHKC